MRYDLPPKVTVVYGGARAGRTQMVREELMKIITRSRPAKCHPDRSEYGRGLCADCYNKTWPGNDPRTPKCPLHPDRPIYQRGLCFECLQKEWHCE